MVELIPYPFGRLVTRVFRELDRKQAIFDLPARKFFLGDPNRDYSVAFHGKRAATPLGPAAGPHSQLAPNIVLSWLGGSRIIELKTVQILDRLQIPRPCIDMHNVGYNVEWSQELTLEQSLEEYVKASMLIEILVHSGKLQLAPGFEPTIFDMSVGYDLKGIQSDRVQAFIAGMLDAGPIVDRLRGEIPTELRQYRDLDFTTRLADSLTLSTFHGCPPDEIEKIIDFLLRTRGLHCVVKLNPTLLGPDEIRRLLHDVLGYANLRTPDEAFAKDTRWEQAVGFIERLSATADSLGLGFGVKLTNTLIVDNHRQFFPATEKAMYLSGPPLHVLAMHLLRRIRARFGSTLPVSFSAGIDRHNFADAVALGLTPITVCTDLLKPGGYGRQSSYFQELGRRMDAVGAANVTDFNRFAHGHDADPVLHNTETYVRALERDPRYGAARNQSNPKKIGSQLELFDCITCDKCIPVCPNDANFTFTLPQIEIPIVVLQKRGAGWEQHQRGTLKLEQKHQIGNVADFCNECGNCDVFCPEDGGPYIVKPRFFVDRESWEQFRSHDGFHLHRDGSTDVVLGRIDGQEFELRISGERARYRGKAFDVEFLERDPAGTIEGTASDEVDLTGFHIMNLLREAILSEAEVNYLNA